MRSYLPTKERKFLERALALLPQANKGTLIPSKRVDGELSLRSCQAFRRFAVLILKSDTFTAHL